MLPFILHLEKRENVWNVISINHKCPVEDVHHRVEQSHPTVYVVFIYVTYVTLCNLGLFMFSSIMLGSTGKVPLELSYSKVFTYC